MAKRPGGPLSTRPLHYFWIVDCSGSMSIEGKIEELNRGIREAIPQMRRVANENPFANVLVRCLKFSHGASWHVREPIPVSQFNWNDLQADPLEEVNVKADIIFLMDTSGSMGGEIRALKESCIAFADSIIKEEKSASINLGLVGFAIGGHSYRGKVVDYTVHDLSTYTIGIWPLASPAEFQQRIQSLKLRRFGGKGCYLANNDTVDIFPRIVQAFAGPEENARILVIVSDELGDTSGLAEIVQQLKDASITTFVLGVPGKDGQKSAHEVIAEATGGEFWNLAESKGKLAIEIPLDDVAKTIAREITKKLKDGRESHGTDLGVALQMIAQELKIPPMSDRAFPPVLALLSDGEPTDAYRESLNNLMALPWGQKAVRIAIGIGSDADTKVLQEFIGRSDVEPLQANNPEELAHHIRWTSTAVLKAASSPASQSKQKAAERYNIPIPRPMNPRESEKAPKVW